MVLLRDKLFSKNNKNTTFTDTDSDGISTKESERSNSGLCQTYTSCLKGFLSATAVLSVMCQPSYAERLTFLESPYNNQSGESVDIRTPTGHSCRYSSPRGPEVTIGGGYTVEDDTVEPVAGIAVRIPLGSTTNNCNVIMQLEEAQIKLQNAMGLFEMGLITKEQLELVAQQTFNTIKD